MALSPRTIRQTSALLVLLFLTGSVLTGCSKAEEDTTTPPGGKPGDRVTADGKPAPPEAANAPSAVGSPAGEIKKGRKAGP